MKIDYELVEKIGATHYDTRETECGVTLYTINSYGILVYLFGDSWVKSSIDASSAVKFVKPIPPKPPVRVEYEKVADSIFDLKEEFERGELYNSNSTIRSTTALAEYYAKNEVYRRIEKPVDWREEVDAYFLKTKQLGIDCTIEEAITQSEYRDEFLEVCRVALRANGEL